MRSKSVKDDLVKLIASMEVNSRIPSRAFISAKWQISRGTADKIISQMQSEGLVYCVKGSGTFVSPKRFVEGEKAGAGARKRHWAIIIPDVSYSIYPKAFSGIESFTRTHNISFVICQTDDDVDTEFALVQREIASGVDGLIIVPAITTTENFRNYNYIARTNTPFVFWQRSVDYMLNIPQMLLNGYYGGYIATKHLLDMGYESIAYLAPKRFRSSMDRYMGYCGALAEAGRPINASLVQIGIPENQGQACARRMLCDAAPCDAFVCYSDKLAVDAVNAIQAANLRVSDDVGVIGFEGIITWLDATLSFGLTYVDINRFESGRAAAEALWELMTAPEPRIQTCVFTPTLCVRNTCRGKSPANPGAIG